MSACLVATEKIRWITGLALILAAAFFMPSIVAAQTVMKDTIAERTVACIACHGEQGRAGPDGYYPRIAGKPAGYLHNQLINFREGRRQYPLMTYLVDHLSDDYLMEIAAHFAAQHPPYPPPRPVNVAPAILERGRVLALQGNRAANIPACVSCHGERLTGAAPFIPGLLGLPHDYLNAQFGAWRNGTRKAAAPDCMAQITRQLKPEDVNAVSAWLASQPVPAEMQPLPKSPDLPIACGSVPDSVAKSANKSAAGSAAKGAAKSETKSATKSEARQ